MSDSYGAVPYGAVPYGLTSTQKDAGGYVVSTAITAGGLAASASAGTVAGTAVVAQLLVAAGASAAVPYAGWIAAGVLATAAAIINLVVVLRKRGVKKQQAVVMAREIGFPDAAAIPGFTLRALEWSSAKRARKAATMEKRIARKAGRGKKWKAWRSVLKLQLLGVIEAMVQADKRAVQQAGQVGGPQAAAQVKLQQTQASIAARAKYDQGTMLAVVAIIGGAALLAVLVFRRKA